MRIRGPGPALADGGSGGARPRCGGVKAKRAGLSRRHNNGQSQSECSVKCQGQNAVASVVAGVVMGRSISQPLASGSSSLVSEARQTPQP